MHKLEYLIHKFKNLSPQGSKDWLEGRKFAFGGSEMATVFDRNPYQRFNEMINNKKKLGIDQATDATDWGRMFEPVAKVFIEKDKGVIIHEFGSIPCNWLPICYSPDGLFVENEELILLEIKCPIFRGVKKIPSYYDDQVQTGLEILPAKNCLFAQFRFRRCALFVENETASYDRLYHKEFRKRCPNCTPEAYGYLYWFDDCDLVDLGLVNSIFNSKPNKKPDKIFINEALPYNKGYVLKWKLFERKYTILEKELGYLEKKKDFIWNKYKEFRGQMITIDENSEQNSI